MFWSLQDFSVTVCSHNTSLFLHQGAEEEAERAKLREVSKRLYAQLQEAEKNHQEERERLQVMNIHTASF